MAGMIWTYRGRDAAGKLIEGTLEAESAAAVAERLREQGYIPTKISEQKRGAAAIMEAATRDIGGPRKVEPARKIGITQLSLLARQLATMIGAGIPLVQSLAVLAQQMEQPSVREMVNEVRKGVESGETFSASLAKFPGVFPPLFVHMVEAGEASGTLDNVLARMADYFEKQVETRGKVKNALVYPIILVAVALIVVMILMMFVLPTFIGMFNDFDMELPLVTKIVFAFGQSFSRYWYLHFGVPIVAISWFISFVRGAGKPWFDRLSLRIPIVGAVIRKSQTAQFARTFGMLVESGVPMLQALDLLDKVSDNSVVSETLQNAKTSVRDGASLAKPLRQSGIFPPMLAHMVGIGEETGALDEMLSKTADFYDQEVDVAVKNLTTAIEPVMIVIIGVIAGVIVAAVMVPMFNMANISM